jgi:hypothetical protein
MSIKRFKDFFNEAKYEQDQELNRILDKNPHKVLNHLLN